MKCDNNKPMAQTGKGYLFPAVIPAALCFLLALAGCRNMFENPGTGNQTPPVATTTCTYEMESAMPQQKTAIPKPFPLT